MAQSQLCPLSLHDALPIFWSVIIVFTVFQTAFGTYILSSVITTVPREMREAAALDGASRWQVLWRIVTPMMRHSTRSEEHTSELQSRGQLVCRLLLEKKTT